MVHPSLASFHPMVAAWFAETFGEPSPPQIQGWPLIDQGRSLLLLAPTGSGKTLAAFLKCFDWLYKRVEAGDNCDDGVRLLYISPLKALNNDIRRNLEFPLRGIAQTSQDHGKPLPVLTAAVRTGDTLARERQQMLRRPPQILITTPESLFLMLSSRANQILKTVRFVIVDEIHTLFATKRGAHLAVTLERLEYLAGRNVALQRIGLSATMQPLNEIAAYLGGFTSDPVSNVAAGKPRPVTVVDTGQRKTLDLQIELPVPELKILPEKSIWPPVYEKLVSLINAHRTTLIFVNNRRLAERITANINQIAGRELARTHHGSIAKEIRLEVEEQLKRGDLPCIVATASLELGIDIGFIDLVVQIESPKEVSRGLQRVGRAGHILGMPSKGRIIPKSRGDLLEAAALLQEMKAGRVEPATAPRNCLDILAQHLVAVTAGTPGVWDVKEVFRIIRGAYNFTTLSWRDYENVLAMLSGNYDAREFLELKPRLFWDRSEGIIKPDPYGKRLVYSSGGTIPDRGYFGVYLEGAGTRLGELDEEFVYERRLGERFVLGTSLWKIEEIRQDRVIVSPAKKGEAIIPFWKADQGGRTFELGKRIGDFWANAAKQIKNNTLLAWLEKDCSLTTEVAANLADYLTAQYRSLGALPTDTLLIVEEFPDETGEWRVLLHSPFGTRFHQALGLLIQADWQDSLGVKAEMVPNDEGIMFHCPGSEKPPQIVWDRLIRENLDTRLAELVSETALFGTVFRQTAGRALVLPRHGFGKKRTPLWLARLKAGNLLQVVSKYPDFPLVIEAYREILQDYYEVDSLRQALNQISQGIIRVQVCRHSTPSPFAHAHLFNFINSYMYETDAPRGERNLQLFGLGHQTLRTILGSQGFRDLFDWEAIRQAVQKAQGLDILKRDAEPSVEHLQYWIEKVGDLTPEEAANFDLDEPQFPAQFKLLQNEHKIVALAFHSGLRRLWVARIHLADYLLTLPDAEPDFQGAERPDHPLLLPEPASPSDREKARYRLISRYARTHGPFTVAELAGRYAIPEAEIATGLAVLAAEGLMEEGDFLPGGTSPEWCEVNILKQIHQHSLSQARRSVEACGPADYLRYLFGWQGLGARCGLDGLTESLQQLEQLWLPADRWEKAILPLRVTDYHPAWLDQLCGCGQFYWQARGNPQDMQIAFSAIPPETPAFLAAVPDDFPGSSVPVMETAATVSSGATDLSSNARRIFDLLHSCGALSLPVILQKTALATPAAWLALEELIFAGMITNDSFGPVRYLLETNLRDRMSYKGVLNPSQLAKMGRWSLLPDTGLVSWKGRIGQIFRRYGMVCREIAHHAAISWGELYPRLDYLENVGKIKRGYFVEGLSGIQYILPEALEMLRSARSSPQQQVLTLTREDPSNVQRFLTETAPEAGENGGSAEFLSYFGGELVLTANGKKMKLATGKALTENIRRPVLTSLVRAFYWSFPNQKITVTQANGIPIGESQIAAVLTELGFEKNYREMILWPSGMKKIF